MRKLQQDQILDSLKMVREAAAEWERLLQANNLSVALQLLVDMSMLLEKVEDFIAVVKGEGTKTAQALDEFQTKLYQIYQTIETSGQADKNAIKLINKWLLNVENDVSYELKPDRIEVVFISSRQSTCDALESAYFAAKNDPDCDALYIPLEIFGKTDMAAQRQFYAKKNIPVVDYNDYDIEAHCPDVVYFDYPYDEFGKDIAKKAGLQFFSEYLRKHCGMLVHIPYFVTSWNDRFFYKKPRNHYDPYKFQSM